MNNFSSTSGGISKVEVLTRIVLPLSCWRIPSRALSFRISFLLRYCNGFRPESCRFGARLAGSRRLIWSYPSPLKPRLCHDERYLNLWIKDLPFKLDHLSDLPRYVLPGHYQTSFDERNGYQHVCLHPSSRTFFGLQWQGFILLFVRYLLAGKLALSSIITWAWRFLVQLIRLAFHFLNISMSDTLVSFLFSRLCRPGPLATGMLRRRRTFSVTCLWRPVIL